jgi:hypothetical protein
MDFTLGLTVGVTIAIWTDILIGPCPRGLAIGFIIMSAFSLGVWIV